MSKFVKSIILYKAPPLLYAGLIICVSTMSQVSPPSLGVTWDDKIYHFGEYFVYSLLIFRAFARVHQSPRRVFFYSLLFIFGLAYAAFDETVQSFIPSRDSSVFDWMADSLGYLSAGTLYLLVRNWLAQHTRLVGE